MTWRQRSQGLNPLFTAKGSHTGSGGRIAHFIVAISFNKGVILCEQYFGKISGEILVEFIYKHFKEAFEKSKNPKHKLSLQDDDPPQNSSNPNNGMYKETLLSVPVEYINKTIESMDNRVSMVVKKRCKQRKY